MTEQGWRAAVLEAVKRHEAGDSVLLALMAKLLTEQDQAKHQFQEMGVAWTGLPWAGVVEEVRERIS